MNYNKKLQHAIPFHVSQAYHTETQNKNQFKWDEASHNSLHQLAWMKHHHKLIELAF